MSSVDPSRMTNAKGTKRSGSSTGGKGGKKGKTKEEYKRVADNLSAQHGAPPRQPCTQRPQRRCLRACRITFPSRGLEQRSPPRRRGRSGDYLPCEGVGATPTGTLVSGPRTLAVVNVSKRCSVDSHILHTLHSTVYIVHCTLFILGTLSCYTLLLYRAVPY